MLVNHRLARTTIWLSLLALFAVPALSPLFTATPTQSADGLLHLYRLVQLNSLWQNGILFSRWLPDLAFGYGLPLFNYYAPLVYYLTTPLHLLGIPFTLSLNLSLAGALWFGAVGIFCFARALFAQVVLPPPLQNDGAGQENASPEPAALLAALAFLYSPYFLFNALQRGNLAEQWALAFAPFALWRFLRLVQKADGLNWSLAVLSFAAVMLSHNVTSFLFAPLLFFFTVFCIVSTPSRAASPPTGSIFYISRFLLPLLAFVSALALSAFFWLSALLERDFVQIARVIVTPDFDYHFNFVPPLELGSLLPRADTGLLNPLFPATLGAVQVILALVSIILLATRFRVRRVLPIVALVMAAMSLTALMLSFSQPVWDAFTLLAFVQLPMRLRGLVGLCLAPVIGVSLYGLAARWRTVAACAVIVGIVLTALPMLYPRYTRAVPPNPTLAAMYAYEADTGAIGTTSFGEYLPVWVSNPPDKSPFQETPASGELQNRLVIPEGVTLCGMEIRPTLETACTASSDSWHALFHSFYFPGWEASLDGQPLTVTPTPRTGLVSFVVPAGGILTLAYVGTTVEHFSEWLSLASAAVLLTVSLAAILKRNLSFRSKLKTADAPHRAAFPSLVLVLLAVGLITFKTLWFDRFDNPFVHHYQGTFAGGYAPFQPIRFGVELELLGFDISAQALSGAPPRDLRVRRGQTLTATLYWRALAALQRNLSAFVHLTTTDGNIVAQQDNLHPANLPTRRWDPDGYVADQHTFEIPSTLAPGAYQLRAGVYDPRTDVRLAPSGCCDYLILATVRVE